MAKNKDLWVLGHKITPISVSGDYDMVIGETPAMVPGPPPHFHAKLKEVFMVLEGEMDFVVDGVPRKLTKGDSIDLPSNVVHTFKNSGSSPCKWLNIHSPKGFLSFFEEMGIAENESEAMKKSIDKSVINRVMKEAANFDMHIKM
ncbi:MAG: cupin domain-containing protein [Saprospiraceae bacterium]|nr:cupin domain-containing protein [Saprospiraceae bacterium]